MIQPLNYTTKAIGSLRRLYLDGSPSTREDIGHILDLLGKAEVFVLPDHGQLLNREKPYPEVPPTMFRPPFPVTAIEYQASSEGARAHHDYYTAAPCPRRIALAFDIAPMGGLPEGGCGVASIAYFAEHDRWIPISGAVVIPYDGEWTDRLRPLPFQAAMIEAKSISQKVAASRTMRMDIIPIWRDAWAAAEASLGGDGAIDTLSADLMDEVNAFRDLCLTLSCKNVRAERHAASRLLNKARNKRSKPPLKDFHILTIDGQSEIGSGGGIGQGSNRRSHLRRGHIRRLSADRVTWVNATIVSGQGGFVDKAYRVGARPC